MENQVKKITPLNPCLGYGTIEAREESLYTLSTPYGIVRCETAVGCLVRPRQGDTVLLSMDEEGTSYILSVLKRPAGAPGGAELAFEGQVELRVNGGSMSIAADGNVSVAAGHALGLASQKLTAHAVNGEVAVGRLSFIGRRVVSRVKKISLVARTVEHTVGRLTQRLKDSFRFVRDQEEVQAGSARYLADDTLTMQAKNAVHMAEEIVSINAQQVHLG